jgi:serine/threonine-protein kinase
MGEVYRADDLKLSQVVALKFLPEGVDHDPDRLARFYNEVRTARQVSHSNVCRVYDIGEVAGEHFLTMEFIDGEDLASLLKRIGRLPEDKGIEIARQLCFGLAAAHEKRVLHRDLKPKNVMIDGRGQVRITDFGLAGYADSIPKEDIRSGTPEYMAPEQLTGKAVTFKSDIYSLGLILYEMFTGRRPYQADSREELVQLQEAQTPPHPSSVVSGLKRSVARIILRCLEKDPRDRPASALAIAAALPGGDPLAIALAEGETPSPEMVADAGPEGSIAPLVAAGLFAVILLGIAASAILSQQAMLFRRVPLTKSPQAFSEKARSILEELGYDEPIGDSRGHFRYDEDYLQYCVAHDPSPDRWASLSSGEPAAMYFWYRQSPEYLVPTEMGVRIYPGRVTPSDPPPVTPQSATVCLDLAGRLIEFQYVPSRESINPSPPSPLRPGAKDEKSSGEVNWDKVFSEAKLDRRDFTEAPSAWNPPVYADQKVAWIGHYPDRSDLPIRVEAASNRGKPVYFKIAYEGWSRPDPPRGVMPADPKIFDYLYAVLLCTLVVAGLLLARRNLASGRGDLRGAWRLASCLFVIHLVCMILAADHVPSFSVEIAWLMKACGFAALWAASTWLMYLALEPYVRRRWPWRLVSWNRLLAGRFRDPLVGRDLLIGGVLGVLFSASLRLQVLAPAWIGMPPPLPILLEPAALTNIPFYVLVRLPVAVEDSLQWFFMIFLLVLLVPKQWIAVGIVFLLVLAYYLTQEREATWVNVLLLSVNIALGLFVTLRFGLLAMTVGFYFCFLLYHTPIVFDRTAWYAGASAVYTLVLVALGVFGLVIAKGSRPWLQDSALLEG